MAFVAGRLEPADLLLRGLEELGEVFLGKPGLLAEGDDLQGHVPRLASLLKSGGECRVLQLLFEVPVEIGLLHGLALFCQSAIRCRAVCR